MNDEAPFQPDRALFERWRAHESASPAPTDPPIDPLLLAAYLDGRLHETAAEALERLIAADPAALDVLIDSKAQPIVPEIASAAFLGRAQALMPPQAATVLPFAPRATAPRRVSAWAAWGAVAASLVLISLVGFDLGMQTERNINEPGGTGTAIDLLDQSNSLLGDGVG